MALAFSQFGSADSKLYAAYLATHYGVASASLLDGVEGVSVGSSGSDSGALDARGAVGTSAVGYFESLLRYRSVCGDGGWRCSGVRGSSSGEECGAVFGAVGSGSCGDGGSTGLLGRCGVEGDVCGGDGSVAAVDDVVVGGLDGPSVSVGGGVRGPNWVRNRVSREKKKRAKERKCGGRAPASVGFEALPVCGSPVPEWRRKDAGCGVRVGVRSRALQESLEMKWKAENELAIAKAQRQKALLDSRDLEQEKKAERTRLQKRVEQDMVAIEKSHASLVATGNVPGVPPVGFAETVVESVPGLSSGSSISPDSSISVSEAHAIYRENQDLKATLRQKDILLAKVAERTGIEPDFIDQYDKRTWTDTHENGVVLDAMYPDGFVKEFDDAPRGKFHLLSY